MKRTAAAWRVGLAACAVLALAAGQVSAAGAPQWLLKAGGLWVSDRTFMMALSVKKRDTVKGEAAKKAAEQFRRLRERLLLAAAAESAQLNREPALDKELAGYRTSHLRDVYVEEKILGPAREAGRKQATLPGQPAGVQGSVFRTEKARLTKLVTADAAKAYPAEIDREKLAQASRGEGGEAVVARVAGGTITAAQIAAGMKKVDHPSDSPATALNVAGTVLNAEIDNARFAALAEREGFAKRADFLDDFGDRALRVYAEAYIARKIHPTVQVTEADIEAEYQRTRASLKRGEEREIFEILVKERAVADAIAARLAAGADFAAEVAAHSISPTKAQGGFFGFLQAGEALPALDAVIVTLQPGQVGPVVRSAYGYHLLRCASIQQGRTPPLAEARVALARRLTEERRAKALAEAVARLEKEIPVEVNETRYQEILKSL